MKYFLKGLFYLLIYLVNGLCYFVFNLVYFVWHFKMYEVNYKKFTNKIDFIFKEWSKNQYDDYYY